MQPFSPGQSAVLHTIVAPYKVPIETKLRKWWVYRVKELGFPSPLLPPLYTTHTQALAGEVGMSAELDEVAKSLYNGQLPSIWRALAPATLKGLGNWIIHFHRRNQQYLQWVRTSLFLSMIWKQTCYLTYHCTLYNIEESESLGRDNV